MTNPAVGTTPPPPWVGRVPSYAGTAVFMLGLLMLIGWSRHFAVLGTEIPALPTMKVNAALAIAVGGASLIGHRPWRRWAAVVPAVIGAATLSEWLVHRGFGIDQLLLNDTFAHDHPGRTSPQICAALLLFGLASLVSGSAAPKTARLGGALTTALCCMVLVLELGWAFNAPELTSTDGDSGMSAPTAVGLALLAVGLIAVHARRRPLCYLWDRGLTGTVVRRLLPAVLLAPPALGLLRLVGQNLGWYGLNLGIAMFAGMMMFLLAIVVTVTAQSIHVLEIERTRIRSELEAIFDSVPATLTMRDRTGRLARVNRPAGPSVKGVDRLGLGRPAEELWPPHVHDEMLIQDTKVRTTGRPATHTYRAADEEGVLRDWEVTKFPVQDADGSVLGIGAFGLDITARREAEREAGRATDRLRSYLDSAPDATVIVDEDGIVRYANNQVAQLLGYTADELVGLSVDQLVPDSVRSRHADRRATYAAHPDPRAMGSGLELTADHRDGHRIPVEISLSPVPSDEGLWVAAAIRDVTARRETERALREAEQRARHLADHDPLTEIWNRRRFESELISVLSGLGTARGADGALMIVDIDHFKAVNDTYGHDTGDRLLVAVAQNLGDLVRTTGAVSRLGGDEFAVMVCEGDLAALSGIAGAVVDAVAAAGQACGIVASGSVGVAAFADLDPTDRSTRATLIRADDALYAAKAAGRGRYVLFGPELPRALA